MEPDLEIVATAARTIREATTTRDHGIVTARDHGHTWQSIANAAGLTVFGTRKIYARTTSQSA